MNKEQAEALCQKWIRAEEGFHQLANLAKEEGDHSRYLRRSCQADILAICRRELQEASGLVVEQKGTEGAK